MAAAALLAVAGAAHGAPPRPSHSFDLQDSLGPSIGFQPLVTPSSSAFVTATVPGAPRPWRVLANGDGNPVHLTGDGRETWSLAVLFRRESGTELLDLSPNAADAQLRYDGTTLTWSGTAGTFTSASADPATGWQQLVLTRDAADVVRVYLDGVQRLSFADPDATAASRDFATLFAQDGAAEGTGSKALLARVRQFSSALSAADVAALDTVDAQPPRLGLREPADGAFTSLRPSFMGDALGDAGSDRIELSVTITDDAGREVHRLPADRVWPQPEHDQWSAFDHAMPPLADAVTYRAVVRAADGARNTTTLTRRFIADGLPPAMTVTEAPTVTTDATPTIAGISRPAPGDSPFVSITAMQPRPGFGLVGVASANPSVVDGRFSAELQPALAPGDYLLMVTQIDQAMQGTIHQQSLRIVAEPGTPNLALLPQPADRSATRLRDAALRTLRRAGLRRLLRGRERVRFAADRAGTATIRVLQQSTSSSRARSSAAKVVLTGRRTVTRAGTGAVALKPTRYGRAVLRRSRRARLVVQARFAPRGGSATSTTARLTVRR